MPKHIKFGKLRERNASGLDANVFDLPFEGGALVDDVFTAETSGRLKVEVSRTLQAVWDLSDQNLMKRVEKLGAEHVLDLAREGKLQSASTLKLNTYNAPKDPPQEKQIAPGVVEVPAEQKTPVDRTQLTFLSEDISEVRDQINALTRELWGGRALRLSQERHLFDMYRNASTAAEFRARIQSLGIIVKDLDKEVLGKAAREDVTQGEFILLEAALLRLVPKEKTVPIVDTFKQINSLRQGYPTHGDNAEWFLKAHRYFDLPYPITDFSASWEVILEKYFQAMKTLLQILSESWKKCV